MAEVMQQPPSSSAQNTRCWLQRAYGVDLNALKWINQSTLRSQMLSGCFEPPGPREPRQSGADHHQPRGSLNEVSCEQEPAPCLGHYDSLSCEGTTFRPHRMLLEGKWKTPIRNNDGSSLNPVFLFFPVTRLADILHPRVWLASPRPGELTTIRQVALITNIPSIFESLL